MAVPVATEPVPEADEQLAAVASVRNEAVATLAHHDQAREEDVHLSEQSHESRVLPLVVQKPAHVLEPEQVASQRLEPVLEGLAVDNVLARLEHGGESQGDRLLGGAVALDLADAVPVLLDFLKRRVLQGRELDHDFVVDESEAALLLGLADLQLVAQELHQPLFATELVDGRFNLAHRNVAVLHHMSFPG